MQEKPRITAGDITELLSPIGNFENKGFVVISLSPWMNKLHIQNSQETITLFYDGENLERIVPVTQAYLHENNLFLAHASILPARLFSASPAAITGDLYGLRE